MVNFCVLCGCKLHTNDNKRFKNISFFKNMVHNIWKKSPYVWNCIDNITRNHFTNNSLCMCMACTHWTTRCCKQFKRNKQRVFIPLDNFLLYFIHPHKNKPDERSGKRFIRYLAENNENPYRQFLESWASTLFSRNSRNKISYNHIMKLIVYEWWCMQNKPNILPSNYIATTLRQLT
jgi:hypothetical protein